MSEPQTLPQEIIIVRRANNDGDGGHHGGAWKIAYADFVTAMMAFFLVMWLINSANEVTKSRVASYFNPIKMTDATASGRGVQNTAERKAIEGKKSESDEQKVAPVSEKVDQAQQAAEEKLLQSPLAALEEIISLGDADPRGAESGIANRIVGDPFDPKAWEALRNGKQEEAKGISPTANDVDMGTGVGGPSTDEKFIEQSSILKTMPQLRPAKDVRILEEGNKTRSNDVADVEAAKLELVLKGIVDKHKSEMDISVTVRRTDEGLLIMLGDNSGRGMFAIGSAKPGAGLIDLVSVIGKILSKQTGDVIIRGHTDGRQYKMGHYDNWQLSTARAHLASYMLIRGGLDESRIKRIEGHGSASPLIPADPLSDSNRRVEFLLRTEGQNP
jgi:chemotaxis protein MotB